MAWPISAKLEQESTSQFMHTYMDARLGGYLPWCKQITPLSLLFSLSLILTIKFSQFTEYIVMVTPLKGQAVCSVVPRPFFAG